MVRRGENIKKEYSVLDIYFRFKFLALDKRVFKCFLEVVVETVVVGKIY